MTEEEEDIGGPEHGGSLLGAKEGSDIGRSRRVKARDSKPILHGSHMDLRVVPSLLSYYRNN